MWHALEALRNPNLEDPNDIPALATVQRAQALLEYPGVPEPSYAASLSGEVWLGWGHGPGRWAIATIAPDSDLIRLVHSYPMITPPTPRSPTVAIDAATEEDIAYWSQWALTPPSPAGATS